MMILPTRSSNANDQYLHPYNNHVPFDYVSIRYAPAYPFRQLTNLFLDFNMQTEMVVRE